MHLPARWAWPWRRREGDGQGASRWRRADPPVRCRRPRWTPRSRCCRRCAGGLRLRRATSAAAAGAGAPTLAITALDLGARPGGADAGPHTGLTADPAEEALGGLLEHLELGVVGVDAQLVEGGLLGLLDGTAGDLDPLHAALPLLLARPRLQGGCTVLRCHPRAWASADPELPDVGSGPEDALVGVSPPWSALLLRELVFEGAGRLPFVAPAFGVAFDDDRAGALPLGATFDEAGIALLLALACRTMRPSRSWTSPAWPGPSRGRACPSTSSRWPCRRRCCGR